MKFFTTVLVLSLMIPQTTYGFDKMVLQPETSGPDVSLGVAGITNISKGEKAPFDGVLFNIQATAELNVKIEQAEARCQLRIDKDTAILAAEKQLQNDILQAQLTAANEQRALEKTFYDKQLTLTTKELKELQKSQRQNWAPLYFTGGVIMGTLLMIAGAYIVKDINK